MIFGRREKKNKKINTKKFYESMKDIFPAFYFGPIDYFADMVKSNDFLIENVENFQKQSYRSRCVILGANGPLRLGLPIVHNGARIMKDIQPSYEYDWRKEHFKSLRSAYLSSPYFEYYEDEIIQLYQFKEKYLLDFNLKTFDFINSKLQLELITEATTVYHPLEDDRLDFRKTYSKKQINQRPIPEYQQVFDEKFGFSPGLSILDLLFNEGPSASIYLKNL